MRAFRSSLALVSLVVSLAACATTEPTATVSTRGDGVIDQILVLKGERKLHLIDDGLVLRSYDIRLGFTPEGHKQKEGDGRTPEGTYRITHRNPQSAFHLSLGISYPSQADISRARQMGVSPGGEIFLHGQGPKAQGAPGDWTAGCIAVDDREIEEIYRLVAPGTPITIKA